MMRNRLRSVIVLMLAVGMLALVLASPAAAATKTVSGYNYWTSLVGITAVKHWSYHTFSYDGTRLLASPRTLSNSWWTLPPTWHKYSVLHWDWYTTTATGTGRSDVSAVFVAGVPTPWGPVGCSLKDGQWGRVKYNGACSVVYY